MPTLRPWWILSLVTVAAGCGRPPTVAGTECANWATALSSIAARADDFREVRDDGRLYARAARVWQLRQRERTLDIVTADEAAMQANPRDATNAAGASRVAFAEIVAANRGELARVHADVERERAAGGDVLLDSDDGIVRVLRASYARRSAAQALALQTACRDTPLRLKPGQVSTLVYDAYAAERSFDEGGHATAARRVANALLAAEVQP